MANLDGYWIGWLVDGYAEQSSTVLDQIQEEIESRKIPMFGNRDKDEGIEVKRGEVDMWWRRDTPELFVSSKMDGVVSGSVATQDYGRSLWVHVWLERKDKKMFFGDNWAKRMHWAAFQKTLVRTVEQALHKIAGEDAITEVLDPRDSIPTNGD